METSFGKTKKAQMKSSSMWLIIVLIVVVVLLLIVGVYYFGMMSTGNVVQTPSTSTDSTSSGGHTYNIAIQNFAFNPASQSLKAGDTIVWTNMDSTPHTVTSDSGSELNSASIPSGGTYSHTFASAGTYAYHCSIHPMMHGSVVVS